MASGRSCRAVAASQVAAFCEGRALDGELLSLIDGQEALPVTLGEQCLAACFAEPTASTPGCNTDGCIVYTLSGLLCRATSSSEAALSLYRGVLLPGEQAISSLCRIDVPWLTYLPLPDAEERVLRLAVRLDDTVMGGSSLNAPSSPAKVTGHVDTDGERLPRCQRIERL